MLQFLSSHAKYRFQAYRYSKSYLPFGLPRFVLPNGEPYGCRSYIKSFIMLAILAFLIHCL